ncbi:hypothetical protein NPIL_545971 [Nephila pilipes]|uniref:Uncharacterized protein n=1 Tax=Nephila pilipes TaxID=299642 RepID=A0A8X6N776_NEPPI|nr:hypothetical protein NPIL_545971 [Nephila pilipes]
MSLHRNRRLRGAANAFKLPSELGFRQSRKGAAGLTMLFWIFLLSLLRGFFQRDNLFNQRTRTGLGEILVIQEYQKTFLFLSKQ